MSDQWRRVLAVCFVCVVAASATVARGQNRITNLDFDANSEFYTYSFSFDGGGEPQTDRNATASSPPAVGRVTASDGMALRFNADFSLLATLPQFPNYNYWGFGGGFGGQFSPMTSPNLSDYELSVDLGSSGFVLPILTGIEIQLQIADGTFIDDPDTNSDPFLTIRLTTLTPAAPEFDGFTAKLSDGSLNWHSSVPEGQRNFALNHGLINFINNNFDFAASDAMSGQDANNLVFIDNLFLTQVPEPGTAAVVGAGLLVALRRRRR